MLNIDLKFKELAEYIRMEDELKAAIDAVKDEIKKYMEETDQEEIIGAEHKVTYKAVSTSRVDTTALRKELPEIAARYTITNNSLRFTFK